MTAAVQVAGGHSRQARPQSVAWLGTVLLLLLGSVPLPSSAQEGPLETLSGTALVISVTMPDGQGQHILGLRTDDGRRVKLHAPGPAAGQAAGLVTGRKIRVAGVWMHPATAPGKPKPPSFFMAASIQASDGDKPAGPARVAGAGAVAAAAAAPAPRQPRLSKNQLVSTDVSVLFIPIAGTAASGTACPGTAPPLSTVAAVKRAAFEELKPAGPAIGGTYNRCSYNTSRLTMANSLVAPVVHLPCNGTTNEVAWTWSKCDFEDFNGYADAAEQVLKRRGFNLDAYKHKVFLLPPSACAFVGLGYVGCNGPDDCRVWMNADFWATPNAIAHELGHNMFLSHAGAVTNTGQYDEYADLTGTMGYCCSDRCPNTPHTWQLGWITMQEMSWASLGPGQTQMFNINSQSLSRLSGLRLTGLPGSDPVFVGYRTRAGGDASAGRDIAGDPGGPGRLHIYTAPITNTWDSKETNKRATLDAVGKAWTLRPPGLVVRLVRATSNAAAVTLCRLAGKETAASCQAGLDNDCNGKVGSQDAACVPLLRRQTRAAPLKRTRVGL